MNGYRQSCLPKALEPTPSVATGKYLRKVNHNALRSKPHKKIRAVSIRIFLETLEVYQSPRFALHTLDLLQDKDLPFQFFQHPFYSSSSTKNKSRIHTHTHNTTCDDACHSRCVSPSFSVVRERSSLAFPRIISGISHMAAHFSLIFREME